MDQHREEVDEPLNKVEVCGAPAGRRVECLTETRRAVKGNRDILLEHLRNELRHLLALDLWDEHRQVVRGAEAHTHTLEQRAQRIQCRHRDASAEHGLDTAVPEDHLVGRASRHLLRRVLTVVGKQVRCDLGVARTAVAVLHEVVLVLVTLDVNADGAAER